VTFTLSKESSAVLTLDSRATRAEIIDKSPWRSYIASGIDSWYALARAEGFEEDQAPESSIVLIKGCDKTSSWKHATFRSSRKGASITFSASAPIPGASQDVMAELGGSYTTTRDLSPEFRDSDQVISPIGPPTFDINPSDHTFTIFVRFYKIGRIKKLKDFMRGTRTVEINDTNKTSTHILPKVRSKSVLRFCVNKVHSSVTP
jgi:hypothetical protein